MDSLVDQRFSDRVDQIAQLYIKHKLEDCIQMIDKALAEVRRSIDELQGGLQNETPQPYTEEAAVVGIIADHDAKVAVKKAEHEADFGDEIRFEAELAEEDEEEIEGVDEIMAADRRGKCAAATVWHLPPPKPPIADMKSQIPRINEWKLPIIPASSQGFVAERMPTPPSRDIRT
ncbi:hypothetical protein B0A48_05624 [Cryoendolithus antarcticus]|uniref:Uncharacterized protein n=1 Tax=Cryoendolithus antarcticus TaxID=1507870 RepID=A0A1V8TJE8_9PEZI|nr:hypothetical protein B0A48_05624 [Cryoendolithus antarcticus]